MSEIQTPKTCGLYLPGHIPHWIQARKGWEDTVNLPLPGRLVSVSDDGAVTIEVGDRQLTLWNHRPQRVEQAAERSDGTVAYQARWHLLHLPSSGGARFLFSVATPFEEHVACRMNPVLDESANP